MKFIEVLDAELKGIFGDLAIVLTILGGVILYSFLYPQPYAKQSVSALATSIVDYDKSDLSRDIIFSLDATPQIEITRRDFSEMDAKDALTRGEIKAIIVIPKDFKRDVTLQKSPTIAVGADSSYFLIYGGVLEGAMKSILTQGVKVKVASLLKRQVPIVSAKVEYQSFSLKSINLFNPNNSYTQYVVPAVFVLILQQTMLIGLGIFGGGINEKLKQNRVESYLLDTPIWVIYLARFIIFGVIFFIHMLFYFGFSFHYFEISRLAEVGDLLTLGVAFIFSIFSLGIFLGTLFNTREIATPAILLSSLPLVFSAGFVWPLEALPSWIIALSMLVPSTPAIQGFLGLNQMGAEFSAIISHYTLLWIQGVIYLSLALLIGAKRREYTISHTHHHS